jgi:hypothetical protein
MSIQHMFAGYMSGMVSGLQWATYGWRTGYAQATFNDDNSDDDSSASRPRAGYTTTGGSVATAKNSVACSKRVARSTTTRWMTVKRGLLLTCESPNFPTCSRMAS